MKDNIRIKELEAKLAEADLALAKAGEELSALNEDIEQLPGTPPGFGNSRKDRLHWTVQWIRTHWSDSLAAVEWKRKHDIVAAKLDVSETSLRKAKEKVSAVRAAAAGLEG